MFYVFTFKTLTNVVLGYIIVTFSQHVLTTLEVLLAPVMQDILETGHFVKVITAMEVADGSKVNNVLLVVVYNRNNCVGFFFSISKCVVLTSCFY